jgi:(p)ppGpp synthase/HD superfamily hydrolase
MISRAEADALAVAAHGSDRTRWGGSFIEHVRRVASQVGEDPDPYAVPAALLHDTVEKGALDWHDLRSAGVDARLLTVVDALTERDNELLEDYLARCAADPLALRIKRADIADKLTAAAHHAISAEDVARMRTHAQRRLDLLDELATRISGPLV